MTISRIFIISRPLLWIWIAGPYLVGMGGIKNFTIFSAIEFLFFLFPLNFFLYGINDIYDRESDEINPRKGDLQGAILKESEIKFVQKLALGIAVIFLSVAATSWNLEHFLISFLFVLAAFLYSHSWTRLKEIPFLDSLIGGPLVYLSPALIAVSLRESIFNIPTEVFLLALFFVGFHAVSTLNDAKYDKAAGMQSTGIFLGKRNTLLFALVTILVPFITFAAKKDLFLTAVLGVVSAGVALLAVSKMKYDAGILLSLTSSFVFAFIIALVYYFLLVNW